MNHRTLAGAMLVAAAGLAHAQDAKKPPPKEFQADFGLVNASGNTSTTQFNLGEKFLRRFDKWEFRQNFGSVLARTDGKESTNLWFAGLRGDLVLNKNFSLFAYTNGDRNRFAGISRRFEEGLGISWKLYTTDVDQFALEYGFALNQQRNLANVGKSWAGMRGATMYKHLFSKTASFYSGAEFLPNLDETKDLRINWDNGLVAALSSNVGMKFGYLVRYDNLPEFKTGSTTQRLLKADRILSAGLQVTY